MASQRTECGRGTEATLTLSNVQLSDAGYYTVVVSNAAGSVRSEPARLTVVARQAFWVEPKLTLADGAWQLSIHNPATGKTVVETSSNLIEWLPVFTNLGPTELIQFLDFGSSNASMRFCRGVVP